MQEKNELSDIILDNKKGDNSNKTKKILFLAIILVLIFIFVIIGMKLSNRPEEKKNNFNIVVPPEPTTNVKPKKEELFKQVPIVEENNTADNFNAMVEKLKNKEKLKNTENKTQDKKIEKAEKKSEIVSKKTKQNNLQTKKEAKATGKIYIQVGVTFKAKPNKAYLQKIKEKGYSYRLYTLKISGKNATKILVGPYKDTNTAHKNLAKVKKEINKAAFVYVIK